MESGAGIGAHALALSTLVGEKGRVYACEADARHRRVLQNNVDANGRTNIAVTSYDPGSLEAAVAESVDGMGIERLDVLKVAEPGSAPRILAGASETLWRTRCALFLALASPAEGVDVAGNVKEFGYRCWRFETALHNPDNFNRRTEDIFAGRSALALLAIPEEIQVELAVSNLIEVG